MKDSALYADSEIINKVLAGEVALFEILITVHLSGPGY
jgi:hypothetical protein